MKNEYLDRDGRLIVDGDVLMNGEGELMLVVASRDDLGVNASKISYIERTGASEIYPLSNFGGQALSDMKYHLHEWKVVGANGKMSCCKCGAWLAEAHEAYPILICSSDYVGSTLCHNCNTKKKSWPFHLKDR